MPSGKSLHIGLNVVDPAHYGGWDGKLNACIADAKDMQAIATEQGFETNTLHDDDGTREAVTTAIENAANSLQSGDIFLLTYFGHGGHVPDRNGDEADLEDETWCLYDAQILDDELRGLYAKFADGVRIFVISDSCHSGTVTRDLINRASLPTDVPARFMPLDIALRTYRDNRGFYNEIGGAAERDPQVKATVLLISGCQDNQVSLDGTFNGRFTAALLNVWRNGQFDGDYRRLYRKILDNMPPTQSPNYFIYGLADSDFGREVPFTV